jgi:hypothetical protein
MGIELNDFSSTSSRSVFLLEHDLRANASRLPREKTATYSASNAERLFPDHALMNLKDDSGQAGIGMAIATLIETTVRVMIRDSDNPQIASDATMASVGRESATGATRP